MRRYICALLAIVLLLGGCAGQKQEDLQVLAQRRDTAEAHMRHMMSVLWTTDTDIAYSTSVNSMGPDMDEDDVVIRLVAGRVYSGMPYTHGGGGAEPFLSYGEPDENGVYQMSGLTPALLSGSGGTKPNNHARLSNDCADAVFWAWSRVGNSFTFTMTQNMTADRGCLPVGKYTTVDSTYKKTRDIAKNNGEAVMFEAYACLQKADGVVTYNGAGHAMMIASVNVVRKGAEVDPEESYVLVHEQFTSNYRDELTYVDEKTGQTVYCLGGVDRKYTFAQLFKKGYLPITIQELIDPTPEPEAYVQDSLKAWDHTSITQGALSCMEKILSVTVTISDGQGDAVQQATCYVREAERFLFHMSVLEDPVEAEVMEGALDPEALAPGSYHCKTECLLGNGETVIARDFDFQVK